MKSIPSKTEYWQLQFKLFYTLGVPERTKCPVCQGYGDKSYTRSGLDEGPCDKCCGLGTIRADIPDAPILPEAFHEYIRKTFSKALAEWNKDNSPEALNQKFLDNLDAMWKN